MYAAWRPDYSQNTGTGLNQNFNPSDVDVANSKLALSGLGFNAFISASSASGNQIYFSSTGALPSPLQAGIAYYISPNAVSGYDIYPEQSATDWQNMPGALQFETPLSGQNFAQKTNKIALTDQGSGVHTIFSDKLVFAMVDMLGSGYTIEGRQGSSDKQGFHRVLSDTHGQYVAARRRFREFSNGTANGTANIFDKSPIQGPASAKLASRQQSAGKRVAWHTQVIRMHFTSYQNLLKVVVAPASINTTTGIWSFTTTRFATGDTVKVQVDSTSTMPLPFIAGTAYFVRAVTSSTFALYPTSADAIADTNRILPLTQGAGSIVVYATQRVGDNPRQQFLMEQLEPGAGGANTLSPNALWSLTGSGIMSASRVTTTGSANGDILVMGNFGNLTKVQLWYAQEAVPPTCQDTGLALANGDYWVTKYTGGSTFGRLHRTLADAQACVGVATVSCSNTQLIKYSTAQVGEFLVTWDNGTTPWALNSELSTGATPQTTAAGGLSIPGANPWALGDIHVQTYLWDMGDPGQVVPVGKIYIDGVLSQTFLLDGTQGLSEAAVNDGTPSWTLHNSAASHVPIDGDSYFVALGSDTNAVPDSDIISLQTYCRAAFAF